MVKRIISVLTVIAFLCGLLAGCTTSPSPEPTATAARESAADSDDPFRGEDDIKLLVWASEESLDLTQKLCDSFIAEHADKKITISVKPQGDGDSLNPALSSSDMSADVFSFSCDQLERLCRAEALAPVSDPDTISKRNMTSAIESATVDGVLYAYPESADDGCYLVYDRSVISDEDAGSLEGILAACRKAGRKFVMDADNGFYASTFLFTGGITIEGTDEDRVQLLNNYDENEAVATLAAFAELFDEYSDVFLSVESTLISEGMAVFPRTVAAGIDGIWNAEKLRAALGDDLGAAKLPTIKVNGEDRQMISLHGCKYVGVSSWSAFPNTAQLLADRLTNETSQLMNAKELSRCPTDLNAISDKIVIDDPCLMAVLDQIGYSVPMSGISSAFWSPVGALGSEICSADAHDKEALRGLLRNAIGDIKEE